MMLSEVIEVYKNDRGWVCPKCGRVYSKLETQCRACNSKIDESEQGPKGKATKGKWINLNEGKLP